MFYTPKYFGIKELVDKQTWIKFGDAALMLLNTIALQGLDDLREFLNVALVVNNWEQGGNYQWSGFRPKTCEVGAVYSQHRLGNAFDVKPLRMPIEEAYKRILENKDNPLLKNITCLEDIADTPTWLHTDFRNIQDRIKIVKP